MNESQKKLAHITALNAQPVSGNETLPSLNLSICPSRLTVISGLDFALMHRYMRMLAAIDLPSSGLVTVLGQDCRQFTTDELKILRKQVAYVLENARLLSVLNGSQNLMLAARYHQTGSDDEIRDKASELLSRFPQTSQHDLLPASMTPLLRRLIAISRPLMLQPEVIFIENPFYGLSASDRYHLQQYLNYILDELNIALVISCDQLDYIRQHARQIVFCDPQQSVVYNDWQAFQSAKHANIKKLFSYNHSTQDA